MDDVDPFQSIDRIRNAISRAIDHISSRGGQEILDEGLPGHQGSRENFPIGAGFASQPGSNQAGSDNRAGFGFRAGLDNRAGVGFRTDLDNQAGVGFRTDLDNRAGFGFRAGLDNRAGVGFRTDLDNLAGEAGFVSLAGEAGFVSRAAVDNSLGFESSFPVKDSHATPELLTLHRQAEIFLFNELDLDNPRLTPITRSRLLESQAFSHEPHDGCLNPHFQSFINANKSLHTPTSETYEIILASTWLQLSCPTQDGISSYRRWVGLGCPNEPVVNPLIPQFALQSADASNILGLLCWDGEIREFMDVRQTATSTLSDACPSVKPSTLQGMISNFETQLLHRMGAILLERKRLMRKISLLVEAMAFSESVINSCYN